MNICDMQGNKCAPRARGQAVAGLDKAVGGRVGLDAGRSLSCATCWSATRSTTSCGRSMPGSGCLTRARPHDARRLVAGGLGLADERGSTIIELIIRCGYHNIRIAKKILTVDCVHRTFPGELPSYPRGLVLG